MDAPDKLEIPKDWTFKSANVAGAFDAHVREQLPWYDLATGIVTHIGRHYIPEGGTVLDVGASTGNVGRALDGILTKRKARLIALDNSPHMASVYVGPGDMVIGDAATYDYEATQPDLIVCFLTLMFVPVRLRRQLVQRMMASVSVGGAVLVFDKMQTPPGHVGSVVYRMTLAAKYEAGASPEEVIAKELSLAGVQRPMAGDELEGFTQVFRFGDFAGWLYERAT